MSKLGIDIRCESELDWISQAGNPRATLTNLEAVAFASVDDLYG